MIHRQVLQLMVSAQQVTPATATAMLAEFLDEYGGRQTMIITLWSDAKHIRYLIPFLTQNGIDAGTVDFSLPITIQVVSTDDGDKPYIFWTTTGTDDGAGNVTPPEEMSTPQLTLVPQILIQSVSGGPDNTVHVATDGFSDPFQVAAAQEIAKYPNAAPEMGS